MPFKYVSKKNKTKVSKKPDILDTFYPLVFSMPTNAFVRSIICIYEKI